MKKLIFLLLIILSGCNFGQGGISTGAGTDITGSEGLSMKLGTIPGTVYLGQSFTIPITLENQGASKVEDAILSISGYNENYVHLDDSPKVEKINLEGKTTFSPVGERTVKIFRVGSISLPEGKDVTQVFLARVCYKYKTIANPVVCINPKLVQGESFQPGTCNFNEVKLSSTQGAPIAVTKVEALPYINEPTVDFLIYVQDVAKEGKAVYEESYTKPCLGKEPIFASEVEELKIEAYLGENNKITCYPVAGEDEEITSFKIEEKGPSVKCRATIDTEANAYTTVLSIHLSYGYYNGQVFTVNLKNPARPGS